MTSDPEIRAGQRPAASFAGRRPGDVPHVVIVGAGFAGLNAARRLSRQRETPVRVTLVDRHNFHTFQPLLYQVATAGLQPQDVGYSVRGVFGRQLFRRSPVRFRMDHVVGVDWDDRQLHLAHGGALAFDLLVLAAGAVTADYGIDGVADHAFPLKSLHESVQLRNHILAQFERVEADPSLVDDGALTFVIAGGGPTGVELSGAMAELVDHVLDKDHPDLDMSRVRILLVEMVDTLLPPYSERSREYTRRALEERGIEVRLGTAIEQVTPTSVRFAGGEQIPTRTVIWTAGVEASPLGGALGLELGKGGRVEVDEHLRALGHDDVYVIGDLAGARDEEGQPLPQLAPVAIQQGRHVADQIAARLRGEPGGRRPFHYVDKGTMATIGRHDAVTELPGRIRIRGVLAWLAWLFLHLMYLVGFRNRVAVFLNWLWNYVTYDRSARLIVSPGPEDDEAAAGDTTPSSPA